MANQLKIRGGTVDYGRIYEQRIAAHLAIKCALDPEVSDFWIVSNIDGVEAFDDIVLMIQDQGGNKKLYNIQLKHLENNKVLQAQFLEAKSSKFSLNKYQKSFEVIEKNITDNKVDILKDISLDQIYLILWTNAPLTGKDKLQYVNAESIGGMDFFNTSSDSNIYKISNKPTSKTPFNEKFLERFYLFANQASATAVDKIIKDGLISHFSDISNSVVITITDYFAKWSMGDNRTIRRITKSDVQMKVLELLLLPYVIEPVNTEDIDLETFDLINDTLRSFNIIPITNVNAKLLMNVFRSNKFILNRLCQSCLNLEFSWSTDLSRMQWDALKGIDGEPIQKVRKILQEKKMSVPFLTIRDVNLAAWQCRLIPLILSCNISENLIENILVKFEAVTKNLSFVLLNPITSILNGNLKIFYNINNLEDMELKNKNLDKSVVSLQGKKKIKLEEFKENKDILESVTPEVYLMLMEEVIEVGKRVDVENYYVQRDLRRPLLKISVLDENSILKDRESMFNQAGDLFLLVEYDGFLPLKYKNRSSELSKYIEDGTYKDDEKTYIIFTHLKDFDQGVILAASHLHRETTKAVHVMKLKANCLEWSFSKGSVETLQKHLVVSNLLKNENPEQNIPEDDILNRSRSAVNIISNNAGMGKTFMLKSIANKFEPDEWVCYINLSEHITKVPQGCDFATFFRHICDYNLKTQQQCIRQFSNNIYIQCLRTGKLIFLFDGFDEISSDHALSLLKEAKGFGLKMWVTTRPTYKKALEEQMENLSVEITHFSTEDHVEFLWKYFQSYHHKYQYDDSQIQYIIETINKCSSNLDKTFIALPLQTRMLAEIFGDDIGQISEKEKLTMVDLYNKFVDVKLKDYKSYEATSLKKTLSKLALKLFFTGDQLEDLLDFEDLSEEATTFRESYKKDSIVIGLNEKGDAVFGHQTFAEFLAAHWLAKQIVNRKGGYNLPWLKLVEKLYYIEMVPVRLFFDKILSQNLPLHIAVLNNDREDVQTLLKTQEVRQDVDALGRSPLHLAVTYGKYYDLYVAREVKGLRNVGLHSNVQSDNNGYRLRIPLFEDKQHRISDEIVDELLDKGFDNATDKLFRYDLFDYAMKSCSLNFVHSLYKRFEKVTLHLEIGFSFEIFLYCIVHDNLYNIISKRKVYNYDLMEKNGNELRDMFKNYNFKLLKMKYNDMYLTELAALTGATETIFDLFKSDALGVEDGNAIHKACFGGHSNALEVLYKMGADIEKLDESNWSPLYQASQRGRADIVYHLLSNSKFLSDMKKSTTKMTPLHYAVQGGHLECVQKLIEYGAKVNVKDSFDKTPLMYACNYGHSDIIEVLLKSGLIDISEDTVKSGLNIAAFHGYSDCVKKLLEYGLDVNNIDNEGNSPLVIASKKGFSNVVSELASSKKCDLNLTVNNESLSSLQMWCAGNNHMILHTKMFLLKGDRKKPGGITALHFAARHGHVDSTKTLIDLGADKHIEDEVTKYTPLVWASMYGHEKVVNALLTAKTEDADFVKTLKEAELSFIWALMLGYEKCVELMCKYVEEFKCGTETDEEHEKRMKAIISSEFGMELMYVRENENIPLLIAAKNGCSAVIKTLVSLKYKNNDGLEEALCWAARNGHVDCVKELVIAGADENRKNEKRLHLLPITWASMYGKTSVVEHFLSNKTSDYLQNEDLHFALNWAAVGGHYECVKLLLNFGLDVDNMDPELGGTPLICACKYTGTVQVVDALMEKNCKVNAKDADGLTALDLAAQKKNFEFVKRFINSGAFQDLKMEKESDLYKNLQLAFKWAVEKEENELIEGLAGLGIE